MLRERAENALVISAVHDREGAHGRAGPAGNPQRDAEELEFSNPDKPFQIDQPFPMADAKLTAKPMLGK